MIDKMNLLQLVEEIILHYHLSNTSCHIFNLLANMYLIPTLGSAFY